MKIYKSLFPLLAVVAVLSTMLFPSRVHGDNPQPTSEQFPIDYRVGNVCSDNLNEIIQLDGTLHVNSTQVADANGGLHVTSHANWQGVEGTNLTTGEKYRFISRGKSTFNTNGELPFTSTMTTHNNMVGQSTGVILVMQIIFKVTVNANGEITTQFAHQSAECKQ
jgi:hypothetical protein